MYCYLFVPKTMDDLRIFGEIHCNRNSKSARSILPTLGRHAHLIINVIINVTEQKHEP